MTKILSFKAAQGEGKGNGKPIKLTKYIAKIPKMSPSAKAESTVFPKVLEVCYEILIFQLMLHIIKYLIKMIILRKSLAIYGISITQLDWKTTWVMADGLLKTKYLGTKKIIVEVRFWVVSHLDLLWVVWKSSGLEKKNGGYTVSLSLCMSLRFVICHP